MPKLKQSASDKHGYSSYNTQGKHEKNKIVKMERALKTQPNNTQLKLALDKAIDKGVKYVRNRKSNGHTCKGLYNMLGFIKNQPNEFMKKSKLPLPYYYGIEITFAEAAVNGQSMCTQFETLGYKKSYVRKYKKTSR